MATADDAPDGFTLVIKVPGSEERTLAIRAAELAIGRDDDNDVVLKRGTVDRKHAQLYWRRGRFVVVDLKRDDGITVDGKTVNHTRAVQPGETVSIGGCTLRIVATEDLEEERRSSEHDDPMFRAELNRRAASADWAGVALMLERLEDRISADGGSAEWRFVEQQYIAALEHTDSSTPEPKIEAQLWGRLSLIYRDRLNDKRSAHESLKAARRLDQSAWGNPTAPPPTGHPPPAVKYAEGETTEQVAIPPSHVDSDDG